LFEELQGRLSRRAADVEVRLLLEPPPSDSPHILQILELPAAKEAGFDVFKLVFNLPLRFRPPRSAGDGLAVVVGDEGAEGGVEDGLARLPPEDDGLFVIVQTFPWNALIISEGVLVPADEVPW